MGSEIKQPAMTEWFAAVGNTQAQTKFKAEDNSKVKRLTFLHDVMELPYRVPATFEAEDMKNESAEFLSYVKAHESDRVAFRMIPKSSRCEKIRKRGLILKQDYYDWFMKLGIPFEQYTVQIFQDEEGILWSTSFVVSRDAIFGDICQGWHSDLSAGEGVNPIYQFSYDYNEWSVTDGNEVALAEAKRAIAPLLVHDASIRQKLSEKFGSKFHNNYLLGYFETIVTPKNECYFVDYNQTLAEYAATPHLNFVFEESATLKGVPVYKGKASGKVVVVSDDTVSGGQFEEGDILVCKNTNVDYLPLMRKSSAIVTDIGSLLSHAAIVARELKKPCIVSTKKATEALKTGDFVEVDAEKGTVTKIEAQ